MIAVAAMAFLGWLYLALLHGQFWSPGPELAPAHPRDNASVDIVVPARDEAALVATGIASLLAQDYLGTLTVTLVDDGSTDDTADRARSVADPSDRLTIVASAVRPTGWAGKLWAVSQGVAQGSGEWLLLTDADIVHEPRHLATLMAHAKSGRFDMVSEMVSLRCEGLAERALIPAFVYFFQVLFPFSQVNAGRIAAAAGGTVLIRRAALERAGGIAAIRDCLIDDIALANIVRLSGGRIWLGHTRLARSVRPYPAARDVWSMITRSAYVQLGCDPLILLGSMVGMALLFVLPAVFALFGHGPARWLGAASWLVMATTFVPTQLRMRPRDLGMALLLPAIAVFYIAATIGSAVAHHYGCGVVWKSRAYDRSAA